MNKIQAEILNCYKEFKKICDKHGLKYFGHSGTAIGTIRHQGFIPWDDDIDVAMPIADYIKFRKYARKELKGKYELIDSLDRQMNSRVFMKIHNVQTTYIEDKEVGRPRYYKGVWLDIFPVGTCTGNSLGIWVLKNKLKFYRKLDYLKNHNGLWRNKKINRVFNVLFFIPIRLTNEDYFMRKWENTIFRADQKKGNTMMIFPWRLPQKLPDHTLYSRDIFYELVDKKFEDTIMKIPVKYDEFLRYDFGDYMKLPPKEKRTTHSEGAIIDLSKSYREYQKRDEQNM